MAIRDLVTLLRLSEPDFVEAVVDLCVEALRAGVDDLAWNGPPKTHAYDLVALLRLSDRMLSVFMQELCIAQLRAGHDTFVWQSAPQAPAHSASAAEDMPMPLPDVITGNEVSAFRRGRRWTQDQLARRLSTSMTRISAWETGKESVPLAMQGRLRTLQVAFPQPEAPAP